MFKFFRQIRYNLLKDRKTGKYLKYAIGEIVLVVIGILIALSINNWNEDRKERISEQKIINRLITEFNGASFELTGDINARKQILKISENLTQMHLATDDYSFSEDSLDIILNQLMRARFYTPSHPTLIDLQSSGRFELLSSDSLKLYLINYIQAKDRLLTIEGDESNFADNVMTPFISNRLNLTKAYQANTLAQKEQAEKLKNIIKDDSMGSILYQRISVTNQALFYSDLLETIISDVLTELKRIDND
jgi:hypothetical protein